MRYIFCYDDDRFLRKGAGQTEPEVTFDPIKTDFYTARLTQFDPAATENPSNPKNERDARRCYAFSIHSEPEVLYLRNGHMIFFVDGKETELLAGDVLVINPYETHEGLIAHGCDRVTWCSFMLDLDRLLTLPCRPLTESLTAWRAGKKIYRHRFPGSPDSPLPEIMENLIRCQSEGNELLLLSSLLRFFDCIGAPDQPPSGKRKKKSDQFIQEILEYIKHANPSQITLDDIASHFNYNKNYFSMLFHKKVGTSITDFCMKYKVELAQSMIQSGNRNLAEVCERSGFNHYTYFFRIFKKVVGISPSDYVKKCIIAPDYRRTDGLPQEEAQKKERPKMNIQSRVLSALVKVFENADPPGEPESLRLTALRGEHVSFQVTWLSNEKCEAVLHLSSPLGDCLTARSVEYAYAGLVGYPEQMELDRNYLRRTPGRFPDYLRELRDGRLQIRKNKYRTVWIEAAVPSDFPAGKYEIRITLTDTGGTVLTEDVQHLTVCNAALPPQKLIHTEWFHADCLADYYRQEVFSESHWETIRNFMQEAVKRGINMIYTPLFTPPIDTAPGHERTTVQLVGVQKDGDTYRFDFSLLERWLRLADACGFAWFEMSHLATNGGAVAAPKVMATVNGDYRRIFGPDTLMSEPEYPHFLSVFVPALRAELERLGVLDRCYFHISDEPRRAQMDTYLAAKAAIAPYLEGCRIMDALSNFAFWETGTVAYPVPVISRLPQFLQADIRERWTYYCCSEGNGFTNRFFSMKLARTRAIGLQLFKFRIDGFLHWGYNFYNSCGSIRHINPYQITDAANEGEQSIYAGFPAGDAFIVYPGANGIPEESIRLLAFEAGLNDLRACQGLAEKTSYEYVMSVIEEDLDVPISVSEFPTSDYYYIRLRNRINTELEKFS